jgi:hypothetical protein
MAFEPSRRHNIRAIIDLERKALASSSWSTRLQRCDQPLRQQPLARFAPIRIATFVLIAQYRMAAHSDRRDHLNLQVDLLAEQEMTLVRAFPL